jgi:hypothetical protein
MINSIAKRIPLKSFSPKLIWLLLCCIIFCKVQAQDNAPHYYRAIRPSHSNGATATANSLSRRSLPLRRKMRSVENLAGTMDHCGRPLTKHGTILWCMAFSCCFVEAPLMRAKIKCSSEIIPTSSAGTPVSFLLPFMYTIGSEEDIAFSFRVKGNGEEAIVCKLRPQATNTFTAGMFKVSFITQKISASPGIKPLLTVSGMMHIRVYPQLLNYGDRTEFIFSSVTHHMDVESSLILGSLYKNMAGVDPYQDINTIKLSPDSVAAALQHHDIQLAQWRRSTALVSAKLKEKGKVEIFCGGPLVKKRQRRTPCNGLFR